MIKFKVGDKVRVRETSERFKNKCFLERDFDGRIAIIRIILTNRTDNRPDCIGLEFIDYKKDIFGSDLLCPENLTVRCPMGQGRYALPNELELVEDEVTGVLTIGEI